MSSKRTKSSTHVNTSKYLAKIHQLESQIKELRNHVNLPHHSITELFSQDPLAPRNTFPKTFKVNQLTKYVLDAYEGKIRELQQTIEQQRTELKAYACTPQAVESLKMLEKLNQATRENIQWGHRFNEMELKWKTKYFAEKRLRRKLQQEMEKMKAQMMLVNNGASLGGGAALSVCMGELSIAGAGSGQNAMNRATTTTSSAPAKPENPYKPVIFSKAPTSEKPTDAMQLDS